MGEILGSGGVGNIVQFSSRIQAVNTFTQTLRKWKFVEEISMGIVSMETIVTLDMKNKFALTAVVMCLTVKKDIQEFVVGFNSTEDVNLNLYVNLCI